jgi:ParB family chromosome partitioning protein
MIHYFESSAKLNRTKGKQVTEAAIAHKVIHVPFRDLKLDEKVNARKTKSDVESLANSIKVHGLLIPLIVDNENKILAGGRRYLALKHNKTPGDEKIPCLHYANGNPLEISMVENVYRVGLHPVDQFEVYVAMVDAGDTVEEIGKRHSTPIAQVRQALALGRLAPEVRAAWREGRISADAAEAFALTTDHKAQAAALKKAGKHVSEWAVKQALIGDGHVDIDHLLAFVGRKEYEVAGFNVNQTLFSDDEDHLTVSDFPALKRLADEKLAAECEALKEKGWKWAIMRADAPRDIYGWKIVRPDGGHFTKEMMANLGCIVEIGHSGKIEITRGYVKPGDKGVPTPKSPKQKKAEAKAREEKKEQTGGLSDALASRLSAQLTAALAEAFQKLGSTEVMAFTIAALACDGSPLNIKLVPNTEKVDTFENDFARYYKLAAGKTWREQFAMLATWVAASIDARAHSSTEFVKLLHPDKDGDKSVRTLANAIGEKALLAAVQKTFDAADYFNSVGKGLVEDAVKEALGKDHLERVSKMTAADAKAYATKHIRPTGWVPASLRL